MGWNVIVITEEYDILTQKGIDKAINAITGPNDIVWHSQPCTGGCTWQIVNMKRGKETRDKIAGHWKLFEKIWTSFMKISNYAIGVGAQVFHEWPQSCSYWG